MLSRLVLAPFSPPSPALTVGPQTPNPTASHWVPAHAHSHIQIHKRFMLMCTGASARLFCLNNVPWSLSLLCPFYHSVVPQSRSVLLQSIWPREFTCESLPAAGYRTSDLSDILMSAPEQYFVWGWGGRMLVVRLQPCLHCLCVSTVAKVLGGGLVWWHFGNAA